MKRFLVIAAIFMPIVTLIVGCKQTKYVPDGKYLLKKNVIKSNKSELDDDDMADIIRQQPNYKNFGMKIKLAAFNAVDSTKVADKRIVKNEKLKEKNKKLREKEKNINEKRIAKAKRKGKDWYTKRMIPLKDTIDPKMFLREWIKYRFGEPPVVFDTAYYDKSIEQLNMYLRKKGYYYGSVGGEVVHKKKKVVVTYRINTGKRYYIDSVYIIGTNRSVVSSYETFLEKEKVESLKGKPFDNELLDKHRNTVAELMRDDAFYMFNYASIDYKADTTNGNYKVHLGVRFADRMIKIDQTDSFKVVPYRTYLIKDVHFHIFDTLSMKGKYGLTLKEKGITETPNGGMTLLNYEEFAQVYYNRNEKKRRKLPVNEDILNPQRIANFYYNGKMFVKPGIIELQNYLENDNYYKEYYLERSFSRLLQLDIFSSVKPRFVEIPETNQLEIHYDLIPAKRQHFSFEPKATNSNGFLGVSASINYNNRNLFRGAEKLTFSLSGGFESQPAIFDESVDGEKIKSAGRSFNTFEFEPGIKLDMPGLLPLKRAVHMAKRQRARTILSASYNYQNRDDFERSSFQFGYLWKFYGAETQIFSIGLPTSSVVKYVKFSPSPDFEGKLNQLNDAFLRNTYSSQFIWQDWKIVYEYTTVEKKNKKSKANLYYKISFDPAGNFLSLFKNYQDTNALGQRTIFGQGYSQFLRLDNEFIYAQPMNKTSSFNMRFLAGAGMPYGNTTTSLPYDYSFFGGGANDNRGWRARALGPGVYKYYLDPNRTATQVGDIRIGASAEFRFSLGGIFKGAVFSDIGNVWTWKRDINRPGSQFTKDWYKQLAVSGGVGLRVDLDFFVIRLDLGIPLSNPSLPEGSKWIFQSRSAFKEEISNTPGIDPAKVPMPFTPILHFGIGYPF